MELSSLTFLTDEMIENIQIGVMINGSLCHLYPEKWYLVRVYLPQQCVHEDSFWFSVYLEIPIDHPSGTAEVPIDRENHITRKYAVSVPIYIPSLIDINKGLESDIYLKITLVLPLTFDDVSRAYLLLDSLQQLSHEVIKELIVLSPDIEYPHIANLLSYFRSVLPFPMRILPDSYLLPNIPRNIYPYAIQMALKILVSSIVSTSAYITLDSDLLLIHPFNITQVLSNNGIHIRALYEYEPRDHHAAWWDGSQRFLQIPMNYFTNLEIQSQAFSVTPAILTVYGSMLLLNKIHQNHLEQVPPTYFESNNSTGNQSIANWISTFGTDQVWSEYTLYRIILDYYHVR